jgi:hypothetical protein
MVTSQILRHWAIDQDKEVSGEWQAVCIYDHLFWNPIRAGLEFLDSHHRERAQDQNRGKAHVCM